MPSHSKLTADEQGFWFASGVVLLVALLLAAYYNGPMPEAVRIIAVLMAFGDAWIVREEIAYPHWEEVPDEKELDVKPIFTNYKVNAQGDSSVDPNSDH